MNKINTTLQGIEKKPLKFDEKLEVKNKWNKLINLKFSRFTHYQKLGILQTLILLHFEDKDLLNPTKQYQYTKR